MKKICALGIFLILIWNISANATVLSDKSASLSAGAWSDITAQVGGFGGGTLLNTDNPSSHINEYADKGVWNPLTREALYVGQAHMNGYQKFIKYSDSQNAFSLVSTFISGSPEHTYQHNAINTANGDLFLRPYFSKTVRRYSGGSWSNLPSIPMPSMQVAGALEGFPERSGLVFVDGDWGVWRYTYASNNWTLLAETNGGQGSGLQKLPMGPYHNVGVYNPVFHILLFGGGNGSTTLYRMDSNGTITTETNAPTAVGINASVFTVDPVSGDYLLFGNDSSFWAYSPGTKSWRKLSSSQNPPFFNIGGDGPALGVVAFPIPTYGLILFTKWAGVGNSRVYVYKHAPGTGAPPPPPDTTSPAAPRVLRSR